MGFNKGAHPCARTPVTLWNVSSPQKVPLFKFTVHPAQAAVTHASVLLSSCSIVTGEIHLLATASCGQHSFPKWCLWEPCRNVFLFTTTQCSMAQVCHRWLINSLGGVHFSCVQFGAVELSSLLISRRSCLFEVTSSLSEMGLQTFLPACVSSPHFRNGVVGRAENLTLDYVPCIFFMISAACILSKKSLPTSCYADTPYFLLENIEAAQFLILHLHRPSVSIYVLRVVWGTGRGVFVLFDKYGYPIVVASFVASTSLSPLRVSVRVCMHTFVQNQLTTHKIDGDLL